MAKLLGSEQKQTCYASEKCVAGKDKQGPGSGHPFIRSQRVIRVTKCKVVLQCSICKGLNNRKRKRFAQ